MLRYGSLVAVGKPLSNGNVVTNIENKCGKTVPYARTDERTRIGTIAQQPYLPSEYRELLVGGIGRSDLLVTLPCDAEFQIQIVGPKGSGRKSLGAAIAARFGYGSQVVNVSTFTSKWLGEWEKNVQQKVGHVIDLGMVPIVYGLTYGEGAMDNSHKTVMVNTLNGIAARCPIIVVSERPLAELQNFINVDVCPGDFCAVREWLEYYHSGCSSPLDLDYIAMMLSSQTIYPSAISSASGSTSNALLNSIRANTLSDLSLAPGPGELIATDFVAHMNALTGQIR